MSGSEERLAAGPVQKAGKNSEDSRLKKETSYARAREVEAEDLSKEELQLRMEEARDSITQTVTEIKETVTQQYETVKDALDWREQFKKRPVAWSLGAAGVGFCVGYGIASAIKGEGYESGRYVSSEDHAYAAQPHGPVLNTYINIYLLEKPPAR